MQVNLQLHHAVTDITGATGMRILRAIVGGERSPEVLAAHAAALRCDEKVAVIAGQAKSRHAGAVHVHHDVLVDLADQDHLRDLERFGVGHAVAVAELRREPEALRQCGDLRAAAVHHDRPHTDHPEQGDVLGEPLREPVVGHRRPA